MTFGTAWYAVAIADGLECGTSAGTRLFDREIVIWRDAGGMAHAWEDRCPHRGMRLSFGFVRGDHIACLYHGWQYDAAGQCRYIPAHPNLDVPDTIRATTYAVAEAGGLLWIWSEPAVSAEAAVPDTEGLPIRSLYVDRPAEEVAAVLMSGACGAFTASSATAFDTVVDDACLRLELQPFTTERAALHIVRLSGSLAPIQIAHWSEGLRRAIEAQPAAVAAGRVEAGS